MGYQKNTWVLFDKNIPAKEQPDAFITKEKLDNIETGIKGAVTDFQLGTISKGANVSCEIISDENDPSVKRINLVIPKEVSWLFSDTVLTDGSVAPTGTSINDMVLDSKGNIFTITENINGVYILNKKLNITGRAGEQGTPGPQGIPGEDANKWIFVDENVLDGDNAPHESNIGDFIFDSEGDVFETLSNYRLKKLFNIHGTPGENGKSAYQLWLDQGNNGSIEQFFVSLTGPSGPSTYDLWKSIGYEGTPQDFLDSLKGDSIASEKLTTLDEVLANNEEGMFVDALVVKEMYLKLQEMITSLKK